jgi:hypothetical protein
MYTAPTTPVLLLLRTIRTEQSLSNHTNHTKSIICPNKPTMDTLPAALQHCVEALQHYPHMPVLFAALVLTSLWIAEC